MLFVVPNEEGRIIQANQVFDAPKQNYIDQMEAMENGYVTVEAPGLISPEKFWCPDGALAARDLMPVTVSKVAIKAGGVDTVLITGAPKGADYRITANIPGVGIVTPYSGKLPGTELETGMETPCLFTIHLTKFPFRDFSVVIEAWA